MAAEKACDYDTPQRHQAGCTTPQICRQFCGNNVDCRRYNSCTQSAGIGRHPRARPNQLHLITTSSSSDRAPVAGNRGCAHASIATGLPPTSDRCQQHGLASNTSQPTTVTGTEGSSTISGGVLGPGKDILRTRISRCRPGTVAYRTEVKTSTKAHGGQAQIQSYTTDAAPSAGDGKFSGVQLGPISHLPRWTASGISCNGYSHRQEHEVIQALG